MGNSLSISSGIPETSGSKVFGASKQQAGSAGGNSELLTESCCKNPAEVQHIQDKFTDSTMLWQDGLRVRAPEHLGGGGSDGGDGGSGGDRAMTTGGAGSTAKQGSAQGSTTPSDHPAHCFHFNCPCGPPLLEDGEWQ